MTDNNPNTTTNSSNIPDGWVETTLGEVAIINPTESLQKGKSTKCVPMDCIDSFTRQISRFNEKEYSGGMKFRNGDTLIARITPCLENGKTAYVNFLDDDEIGFGSTEYIVVREKQLLSDKKFLYYLAISPRFREIAIKAMTGTSGRQRVQTDVLINKNFFFPPLPEQQAIASVLSAFDDKIELLREQNKTLEELGQTIFNEWFGKYSVEGEDSKPSQNNIDNKISVGADSISARGSIPTESKRAEIDSAPTMNQNNINANKPTIKLPEGWRVGKLSEIAEFLNGIALQKFPAKIDDDFLPVIKIRELKAGITAQTDKASKNIDSKYIVDDGDVLFSWSGSLEIVIWKYGKGALNQHLFKVSSLKYPKWFYYFWTLYHLAEFREIASNKATTMGHIQRHHLDEAHVIIPDVNIMQNFDTTMAPILEKIMLINQEIQSLTRTRDELLPRLMSGVVRVNNVS